MPVAKTSLERGGGAKRVALDVDISFSAAVCRWLGGREQQRLRRAQLRLGQTGLISWAWGSVTGPPPWDAGRPSFHAVGTVNLQTHK
jgi:hypothetical protein